MPARPADGLTLAPLSPAGADLDQAAVVAARAFHIDPFFEWLEPRDLRRARALGLFFRGVIAHSGPGLELTGARRADGRVVGVCGWVAPGAYPPPALAQARQVAAGARGLALSPAHVLPGARYLYAVDRAHPHDPTWYLLLLVTDPIAQRQGIGTALLEAGLARADEQGIDCYLETQKEDNLAYYRRFGWEVLEVLSPVRGGPPLWTMRRASR